MLRVLSVGRARAIALAVHRLGRQYIGWATKGRVGLVRRPWPGWVGRVSVGVGRASIGPAEFRLVRAVRPGAKTLCVGARAPPSENHSLNSKNLSGNFRTMNCNGWAMKRGGF